MRGDFSRVTFRPENHFSGVLLQQGRVQLDAEFNEHVAIEAHRDRETTRDVIGRAGAPLDGGGFAVSVASMLRGVAAGQHAWAVGEDGTILRSPGGKKRWEIEPTAPGARLNAVHLGTETTGWAVGDRAAALQLDGTEWTSEDAGVTADLFGVYAGETDAWAVGAAGTVIAWDGSQWQRQAQDADVTAALRDVHFAGDVGVAVGDAGTILTTENRGAAWKLQPAPEGTGDLHGVFLVHGQHGWAVGEQGTVLFYDGSEWTAQAVPGVTATLRAVALTSATEGVAVGDGGMALVLEDGTWLEAPTGVEADLRAVTPLSGAAAIAVGDDVAITWQGLGEGWTAAPDMPAGENGPIGRTLALSAGDIYVEGVRYENERITSLDHQPEPPLGPRPKGDGTFGVVLEVQEQLLTATEREDLREVALGGPDSATRTRSVWQASVRKFPSTASAPKGTCAELASLIPADGSRGLLRARATPAAVSTSECVVPPNGGYRRLENQLYRVEIHAPSTAEGGATYTWSRDNGSMIARLEDVTTDASGTTGAVTVSHIGRDAALGFGPAQLVEITDEGRMLRGQPGVLAKIGEILGRKLLLSNIEQAPLTMADFPVNPIVRRWDGSGTVQMGTWVELEDGVFVEFAQGSDPDDAFRTGDYWTIPARTLSGRVEWPQSGGVPRFEHRHGARRHRTPLAVVTRSKGIWLQVRDCRKLFPPLTKLVHMYYVGGDGQEIRPPTPLDKGNFVQLDETLDVGVVNGSTPLEGAIVEFTVFSGGGKVGLPEGTHDTAAAIPTDSHGVARCSWQLGGEIHTQVVEARFLDPLGQSPPQVIRFKAQLSAAEWVAYDGSACAPLAGSHTVSDAIGTITRLAHISPLSGSGEDVLPDEEVAVAVVVTSDCAAVEGATVKFSLGKRGKGKISGANATTNAAGIATCTWSPDDKTPTQDLTATLTAVPSPAILNQPAETRFVANLNLAGDTAYTPPAKCPEMKDAKTVKDALDRLASLLPRLYHVSGDGREGPAGDTIPLTVGIANRCGIEDPRVRFERWDGDKWNAFDPVAFEGDIATLEYQLDDEPHQFLRARLLGDNSEPVGDPVYFTLAVAAPGDSGERRVPAARVVGGQQPTNPRGRNIVEFEKVEFGEDLFDPPSVLVARKPGIYTATGEVEWSLAPDSSIRGLELHRNGERVGRVMGPSVRNVSLTQQATAIVRLDEGDKVQLTAIQGAGDIVNIETATLSLAWLSA